MKTLSIIQVLLISFLMSTPNWINAQSRRHHKHRGEKGVRESKRLHRHNHHDKDYHYSRNDHSKHHKHYHQKHVKHNNRHHSGCNVNYRRHERHHHYQHHHCYSHDVHSRRYFRKLPSRHYVSVRYGNDSYYYCDGLFFAYRPNYGYWEVNLDLPIVKYRPRHCNVRVVRGRDYIYNDGCYYLPDRNGSYMVCRVY